MILSLLYAFLYPLQVVVFGIVVVFVALVLHFNAVPFRQKFHNLMEYIVLLATLLVLFMGFLFYVELWPALWLKTAALVVTIIIIVACSVLIVVMSLNDLWTRRTKDRAKQALIKAQLEAELGKNTVVDLKKQYKTLFPIALKKMNKVVIDEDDDPNDPWNVELNALNEQVETYDEVDYSDDEQDPYVIQQNMLRITDDDEDEWIVTPNQLAVDDKGEAVYAGMSTRIVRVEFDLPFYATDKEESEEENSRNINDVIDSLFTVARAKRKMRSIKTTVQKTIKRLRKNEQDEDELLIPDEVIVVEE